jgi:hypothetical protein
MGWVWQDSGEIWRGGGGELQQIFMHVQCALVVPLNAAGSHGITGARARRGNST